MAPHLRRTFATHRPYRLVAARLLWLLALLTGNPIQAQEITPSVYLEEELEELAVEGEEEQWEDELEALEWLQQHPIEVNSATRSDWEQLPFLDEYQIADLLDYLAQYGAMKSLNELYAVRGLSRRTVRRILPYLCIEEPQQKVRFPSPKELLQWGHHRLESRIDIPLYTREGYRKAYLGPSLYHSVRYRYRFSNHIQLGLTAEKDAGEPLFALHNSPGYDYYSPYLFIRDYGKLQLLALGNYRLHLGLGLTVGSGFWRKRSIPTH
ncbi:MAG: ComEA family DNA-binding protein [Bacteroides sp.]